ncbi:hypothetical protein [Paratractidigestivibacter sp.]|uniref:hypothetical protein n=1 Tax=Paratractidigestivibacter sp. TaxID=2847316 RepID=UPI002AC9A111|nr:hypothetical protein [Paratractidigestivibacter sp.]
MAKAKATAKDFGGTVEGVADSIGGAFGGSVKNVLSLADKIKGIAKQFNTTGLEGAAAAEKISGAFAAAGGAIAGLGLAAAIALFKQLNAEADRYRQTMSGERQTLGVEAYTDTFAQTISEQTGSGKVWATLQDKWKKDWAVTKGALTSVFTATASDVGVGDALSVATEKAKKAETLAREIYDLQERIKDETVGWKNQMSEISDLMRTASDTSGDISERNNALSQAKEKQIALGKQQTAIYGELASKIEEMNSLTESGSADLDKVRAAQAAAADAAKATSDRLKEMDGIQNGIKSSAAAIAKAWQDNVNKALAEAEKAMAGVMAEVDAAISAREKMMTEALTPISLTGKAESGKSTGIVGAENYGLNSDSVKAYAAFMDEMVGVTQYANDALNEAIVGGIASSFQYLANCMAGLEQISPAGVLNAVLSPLAEMAIKMGEVLVGAGLASDSLKTLITNPYTAIAAGTALIAIGSMAAAGLQAAVNSATGTSYTSASVASSSYSSYSDKDYDREMTLTVTGTLTADGSKLVAVLNNEANRKRRTT